MESEKILIVEDTACVAAVMQERIRRAGYDVAGIATTGEEAIRFAEQQRPRLLLVDVSLPGDLDGVEAVEKIRSIYRPAVIYVSASESAALKKRADKTEPEGYLTKPYEPTSLIASIARIVKPQVTGPEKPAS